MRLSIAHPPPAKSSARSGFTLIELSIVLVIIGLIIGGILIGQNMIDAAAIRAQIAQIEKYNQAVNTFKVKYGYIPGDIPDPYASQFGFQARGTLAGQGDGNGIIEGNASGTNTPSGSNEDIGETVAFWVDLSAANMIDGKFNTAYANFFQGYASGTALNAWFPTAKIGQGNFIYVWSMLGRNYYSISTITSTGDPPATAAGMTVAQSFAMDKKVDDGLPQSGNVQAFILSFGASCSNAGIGWAAGGGAHGASTGFSTCSATTASTPGSSTTCYDNGSSSGPQQYSMEVSNGSNPNCALSFKMQGAAR